MENHYELIDSGSQWQEVQKQGTSSSIQQANVISSNRRPSVINSNHDTESEASNHQRRQRRSSKHRNQMYPSPNEPKSWLPDELKKHLEFDLIDTSGMSEQQLKEIPYTVVQTNHAKQLKLKPSWSKR